MLHRTHRIHGAEVFVALQPVQRGRGADRRAVGERLHRAQQRDLQRPQPGAVRHTRPPTAQNPQRSGQPEATPPPRTRPAVPNQWPTRRYGPAASSGPVHESRGRPRRPQAGAPPREPLRCRGPAAGQRNHAATATYHPPRRTARRWRPAPQRGRCCAGRRARTSPLQESPSQNRTPEALLRGPATGYDGTGSAADRESTLVSMTAP